MTSTTAVRATEPSWRANAYVALFLSALVPGLGQVYTGRRRRGYVLLAITGLALIVMALMLRDRTMWLTWWFQPSALRWMLGGNAALLAFRVYAAADAYAVANDAGWERLAGRAGYALGAFLIGGSLTILAIPHA